MILKDLNYKLRKEKGLIRTRQGNGVQVDGKKLIKELLK